jgi:hypothetical protein
VRARLFLAFLSLTALSGCSGTGPGDAVDEAGMPLPLEDALAAYGAGKPSSNVHRLGQYGDSGTAEIDACGHWLFIDAGSAVRIVDVSDPSSPEEVSRVEGLPGILDVKTSDDCDWLFVGEDAEASMDLPTEGLPSPVPQETGTGGFYVVDVSDKTSPNLVSSLAVGLRRGPHMVYYHNTTDGRELVFGANADVSINEFDRETGTLRELSRYQPDIVTAYNRDPEVFDVLYQGWTHDMVAVNDPATGKTILYTASWDAGLRTVDLSDPENPVEIGGWNDFPEGHEGNVHTVSTDVVGDRTITVGAVEVGFSVVGGYHYAMGTDRSIVYIWDTTDPANILLLGTWENPGAEPAGRDLPGSGEEISSTHNLQLEAGRIYLAHYALGVFVLDVSTHAAQEGPTLLGYHQEPDDNVWDVVLADGILYSSGAQGVVILHYAPDIVGPEGIDSNA